MQRKTKFMNFDVKMVDEKGTIEGYGNTFGNVDSYGDIVQYGAFTKTLKDRGSKIKMLNQHRSDQVIGVWDELFEDSTGLRVKGRINLDTQLGKEAYSNLKMGCYDGLSIGFVPIQANYDSKSGINFISEVKLYEVSLVTFPANEQSTVTAIKSEFEENAETLFDTLDADMRVQVVTYINNLKKLPLDGDQQPPTVEASTGNTEEQVKPDENDSKPQQAESNELHLMEQLLEALQQRKTTLR